jgi:hypothetical protein
MQGVTHIKNTYLFIHITKYVMNASRNHLSQEHLTLHLYTNILQIIFYFLLGGSTV